MKVPRFSWNGFLIGRHGCTVTWRHHLETKDYVLEIGSLRPRAERDIPGGWRTRTEAEGAGEIDIPDDWLHPCNSRGTPCRRHEKNPHHWIISEKGWNAVREEARAKHADPHGKYSFEGQERVCLSNAKYWVRTMELRAKKGIE